MYLNQTNFLTETLTRQLILAFSSNLLGVGGGGGGGNFVDDGSTSHICSIDQRIIGAELIKRITRNCSKKLSTADYNREILKISPNIPYLPETLLKHIPADSCR